MFGSRDLSVGAFGSEVASEVVTGEACLWGGGKPGVGLEEPQHVEVSRRRHTQQTGKRVGEGNKLPVINHASAPGYRCAPRGPPRHRACRRVMDDGCSHLPTSFQHLLPATTRQSLRNRENS